MYSQAYNVLRNCNILHTCKLLYILDEDESPLQDWADLWRPDLAGKIAMVDSPREVIGAVLKYLGASYNTSNIDSEVTGGRNAVKDELSSLRKQVY